MSAGSWTSSTGRACSPGSREMLHPKPRGDLTFQEIDGESVVYDEASGQVHHLNNTATIVFTLLDGSASIGEIAADIAEAAELPLNEIQFQVHRLVEEFHTAGLLEGDAAPGA